MVITGKGKSSSELRKLRELIMTNPENVEIILEHSSESHSLALAKKAFDELERKFKITE